MGKDADLLEGARNGNFQVVEKILSSKARRSGPLASLRRGPGANIQDNSGYTGLHHAALNGHKDCVSLFLSHEASVNIQDSKGSTPLHLACWAGHNDVVKTLLLQGPSVPNVNHQNKGGETALHCAAQYGHTEAADLLLSRGGDPTISNLQAETPLDLAAQYGRLHTAEVLLRAHPDLLRPFTAAAASAAVFPHTPLHRASRNGHLAVVTLLLSQGHHVNVRTGQGAPLHEAALCGKTEVVKALLEAGADSEVRNDLGHTVLDTISSINTPVTQEITSLIKCHHTNQLVNLDDDDDSDSNLSDDSRPPSWLPSPPMSLILASPHDFGSLYENVLVPTRLENVLVPTRLHSPPSDGESLSRYNEHRSSSRASDRDSRTSDRDSRTSDKDFVMSDIQSHIVSDGRNSVASRMSGETSDWSVYDVPPPPKSLPDRKAQSRGVSECEDDGLYEVPPPPRSCRSSMASLRTPRDSRLLQAPEDLATQTGGAVSPTSSVSSNTVTRMSVHSLDTAAASKVVETIAPRKPPRRSMCPPSPTPESAAADQDSGAYEYICFAASGNKHQQSEYENVEIPKSNRGQQLGMQQQHLSRSSGRPASSYNHDSSDSEYDVPRPTSAYIQSVHGGHSNKTYGTISFKPVKSRRTSKNKHPHVYENTQHSYENTNTKDSYQTGPRDLHYATAPRRPRASSAYAKICSKKRDSSEGESEGDRRPKSLDFKVNKPQDASVGPRTSRDIETETEEILCIETGGGGSSSLGSSASLVSATSDEKSISADNIEEFKGDVPFAGLFRGSVTPMDGDVLGCLDRPRSLTTPASLKHRSTSLDKGSGSQSSVSMSPGAGTMTGPSGAGSGGSLLSPLEEAEEWARINDIMASFGSGVARESVFMAEIEQEFQTRLGLSLSPSQQGLRLLSKSPVPDEEESNQSTAEGAELTLAAWLSKLRLQQYEDVFLAHGYDTTNFLNGGILEVSELQEMGITSATVQDTLIAGISKLPKLLHHKTYTIPDTLDKWLTSLHLQQYENLFTKSGFGDMERVKKVWEIELTAVLEISRLGHRKRILASLGERPIEPELPPQLDPHDLSLELSKLNSDISQLKEQLFNDLPTSVSRERRPPETATNTIRRSGTKKRSAPQPPKAPRAQRSIQTAPSTEELDSLTIREPNQLVVGVPNNNLTAWRHHPHALVQDSVQYVAQYLGSTHVKELKGTESTMKSIQKVKNSTAEGAKVPRIVLSVSYRGVKFIDAVTLSLVCQHEIRNIHCACQDAEDLSHFAYITKDCDTKGHYCHIFRVQSRELATEIILTLGEAFEVAYQLALKEHTHGLDMNQSDEQKLQAHGGHTRSKSEHAVRAKSSLSNGDTPSNHTRSHSTVQAQSSISGVSSSSLDNLLSDSGNGSEKETGSRRGSIGSYITSLGGSPSSSSHTQMNGT